MANLTQQEKIDWILVAIVYAIFPFELYAISQGGMSGLSTMLSVFQGIVYVIAVLYLFFIQNTSPALGKILLMIYPIVFFFALLIVS